MKRQVQSSISNPQTSPPEKTQQLLISSVQAFLKQKHNIELKLPQLHSLIDKKVNLKVSSIPLVNEKQNWNSTSMLNNLNTNENRYWVIMQYIELLLGSSTLDLKAIEAFMAYFTKVIDNDVDIIQKNEVIRRNSFKIKEKLQFKVDQISKKTQILNIAIEKLHDKQDILSFIAIDIKNYLYSVKFISDQYDQVRTVEVNTPLKIDHIYEYEISSQQDYNDHYEPLLEVLVRLRANMQNLFQSVKTCDRIDMPLKSVNLLANCKNLLTELEQYLVTNRCAFNRLIFHVVTQQSQNMKLIAGFYQQYIEYVRQLIFTVFRCVYQGHLFKGQYQQLGNQTEVLRNKINQLILKINVNGAIGKNSVYSGMQQKISELDNELSVIKERIKVVQKIICFDKTSIMRLYLEEKICKKLRLLLTVKNQVSRLKQLLFQARKYINLVKGMEEKIKQFPKIKSELEKQIKQIRESQQLNKSKMLHSKIDQDSQINSEEKRFERAFIKIQNKSIQISSIQRNAHSLQLQCSEQTIKQQYFPELYNHLSKLKQQYSELQSSLLQSYQQMLSDQSEKQEQAIKNASKTIKNIVEYLLSQDKEEEGATYTGIGGQIINEDQHCQLVKMSLQDIDKAEFFIGSIRTKNRSKQSLQTSKDNMHKLEILRRFLQWLLVIYEGSMDEHILLNVADKLDFNQQSQSIIQKNIAKVQQLLKQVQKYSRELKKISKGLKSSTPLPSQDPYFGTYNKINNKLIKILRQRQNLYEMIQILYVQFLSVYSDLKNPLKSPHKVDAYDFQSKGIQLFNKKLFDYALLCYHCLNKISIAQKQLNDSNLVASSKNFINDDLLQLYNNRLQSFLKFNESQMLELTLGLEKALNVQRDYKNVIRKWQEAVALGVADKTALQRLKQRSGEVADIEESIVQVQELGKKKFVVLNIDELKKIQKQCEQHLILARQLLQIQQVQQLQKLQKMAQSEQIKNEKLKKLLKQIKNKNPNK